jgi:hypothetical protein
VLPRAKRSYLCIKDKAVSEAMTLSAAQLLKHDVANIVAAKVGLYEKPRTNFLMYVTIMARDECINYAHRLIYGYSHKTNKFTLIVRHVGFQHLMVEGRNLVSKMKQVQGAEDIHTLRLTTRYGTLQYLINANTQQIQHLMDERGCNSYATEITISFADSNIFYNDSGGNNNDSDFEGNNDDGDSDEDDN